MTVWLKKEAEWKRKTAWLSRRDAFFVTQRGENQGTNGKEDQGGENDASLVRAGK